MFENLFNRLKGEPDPAVVKLTNLLKRTVEPLGAEIVGKGGKEGIFKIALCRHRGDPITVYVKFPTTQAYDAYCNGAEMNMIASSAEIMAVHREPAWRQ